MGMKATILTLLSTICLASCSMQDETHYYVTPELDVFVNRFFDEAHARGLRLQKDGVSIRLADTGYKAGAGVEGISLYSKDEINLDRGFVTNLLSGRNHLDSMNVEYVVFHEMAHYFLHRSHLSPDNYTIMTADDFYKSDFQVDFKKRKVLVDELFYGI